MSVVIQVSYYIAIAAYYVTVIILSLYHYYMYVKNIR